MDALESKGSLVRFPADAHNFILFLFFLCLFFFPVANSLAKTMQMKSSMTFTQSNGCKDINSILNMTTFSMMTCQL